MILQDSRDKRDAGASELNHFAQLLVVFVGQRAAKANYQPKGIVKRIEGMLTARVG